MNVEEINTALALCREAWSTHPKATHAWCCHHEVFAEKLIEPAENRIAYILSDKPLDEQVTRLNNFRPIIDIGEVLPAFAEFLKITNPAYAEYLKIHDTAFAEYHKITNAAYAEYLKIRDAALAEFYEKVKHIYQKEVPLGTWNGKSIFD